jgi:hypothetical protein
MGASLKPASIHRSRIWSGGKGSMAFRCRLASVACRVFFDELIRTLLYAFWMFHNEGVTLGQPQHKRANNRG